MVVVPVQPPEPVTASFDRAGFARAAERSMARST